MPAWHGSNSVVKDGIASSVLEDIWRHLSRDAELPYALPPQPWRLDEWPEVRYTVEDIAVAYRRKQGKNRIATQLFSSMPILDQWLGQAKQQAAGREPRRYINSHNLGTWGDFISEFGSCAEDEWLHARAELMPPPTAPVACSPLLGRQCGSDDPEQAIQPTAPPGLPDEVNCEGLAGGAHSQPAIRPGCVVALEPAACPWGLGACRSGGVAGAGGPDCRVAVEAAQAGVFLEADAGAASAGRP